jgi:hypothetical protein
LGISPISSIAAGALQALLKNQTENITKNGQVVTFFKK